MSVYLQANGSYSYQPRTRFNAENADVTIAFTVDQYTAGERLTRKLATEWKYIHVDLHTMSPADAAKHIAERLPSRLNSGPCEIINIAGNGVYTCVRHQWSQVRVNQFVYDTFVELRKKWGISPKKGFRSGGQTGVDIAAAVMAEATGIDAVITFPRGFRMRGEDNQDFCSTKEKVAADIKRMAAELTLRA